MRRVVHLLLLVLVVAPAGCGGQTDRVATRRARVAPDPARALARLIAAAHDGDAATAARLLVPGSRTAASELREGIGSFAGAKPRTLYRGGGWAVAVVSGSRTVEGTRESAAYAAAFRLVDRSWRADLTKRVRVAILGPRPGSTAPVQPQVAAELRAPSALKESGLWLDGRELLEKGGGSPTRGSIYGAPDGAIARGLHVAVAYARAGAHGTAVAWVFRV